MNRPVSTPATHAARQRKLARRQAHTILVVALTVAALASLHLSGGDSALDAPSPVAAASRQSAPRTAAQVREAYGQLPLSFEANRGQADESVNFVARGAGYTLALSPTEAVFALARPADEESRRGELSPRSETGASDAPGSQPPPTLLRMNLIGANRSASVAGVNELEGKVNYFLGSDPAKWRTDVPTFGRVRYAGVYQGIDVVYYGNQRQLEYDFVVAPGRDARSIALEFGGAGSVEVEAWTGDLLVRVGEETIRQHAPVAYQETAGGVRREVESRYALRGGGRVSFEVGEYDRTAPLVIDPVLVYSTYLGGSGADVGRDIAVDSAGNAYVTGITGSPNFPTANPLQSMGAGFSDAFVAKFNAAGSALVYATYLGGNSNDRPDGIAVDSAGNAYLAGFTQSTNFPTANAFQSTGGGDFGDAFVTKLNATGSALVYSTYLGGSSSENVGGIAVNSSGEAYVAGLTGSANFPIANAFQSTKGAGSTSAFVTKFSAAGSTLVYSTFLGGDSFDFAEGIAVDSAGNAYVTGETGSSNFPLANAVQSTLSGISDAFVTKLNAAGSALVYSTYLGGTGNERGFGISVDSTGNAYVTGTTDSTNFPIANVFQSLRAGSIDAFVTKLNASGSALMYSTYLGGSGGGNIALDIAVDSAGSAYVSGETTSASFPTANAIQTTRNGSHDAFVTKFNAAGSALVYSTYLGGSGGEFNPHIAVDSAGNAYLTGETGSTNFPTASALQGTFGGGTADAFVTKISAASDTTPTPTPTPNPACSVAVTYSTSDTTAVIGGDMFFFVGVQNRTDALVGNRAQTGPFTGSITFVAGGSTPVGEYRGTISQTITFDGGASATLSRGVIYTVTSSSRRVSVDNGETKTVDLGARGKIDVTLSTVSYGTFPSNGSGTFTFPARIDDATYLVHDIPGCSPTPTPTPTPTLLTAQFSAATYGVGEADGSVTVAVTLSSPAPAPLRVDYQTAPDAAAVGCDVVNGAASERCDFTTTLGTLRFNAGEASKSFRIFITDDAYVEGNETVTLSLSNPVGGATLGTPNTAVLTVADNDTPPPGANPVDASLFFVRMHYVDFLNREGEAAGVAGWVNSLNTCQATDPFRPSSCDRIEVSSRFFRSDEFMLKGLFVIRFYKVALGVNPGYRDFTRDSQRVTGETSAEVFANRDAFAGEFVERADFRAAHDALSNQGYVDKLEQTAGVTLSNKPQLVADLNAGTKTRAQVLREVVESAEVRQKMFNDSFVLMEYYGYLRRDPEPDGFNAWLTYLNAHPGDYRTMVRGFFNSVEYRKRFGAPGPFQPGQSH